MCTERSLGFGEDGEKEDGGEGQDTEKQDGEKADGSENLIYYKGFELQPTLSPALYQAMQKLISDDDGDGVINMNDKCAGTEKGWIVDKEGCALTLHLIAEPKVSYSGALYDALKEAVVEPKIVEFTPANGSNGKASVTACYPVFTVTYDSEMDAESFAGKVKIFSATAQEQSVGFEVNGSTVKIQALKPLQVNADYFVMIYAGVKSKGGGIAQKAVAKTIHTYSDYCN